MQAIQPSETGHWIYQIEFIQHLEALLSEFEQLHDANKIDRNSEIDENSEIAEQEDEGKELSFLATQSFLLHSLAQMLKAKGQFNQALTRNQQALDLAISAWGEDSSHVATARNNLGLAYKALGQYDQAIEYYQLALDCLERVFTPKHPYVEGCKNNLNRTLGKNN